MEFQTLLRFEGLPEILTLMFRILIPDLKVSERHIAELCAALRVGTLSRMLGVLEVIIPRDCEGCQLDRAPTDEFQRLSVPWGSVRLNPFSDGRGSFVRVSAFFVPGRANPEGFFRLKAFLYGVTGDQNLR